MTHPERNVAGMGDPRAAIEASRKVREARQWAQFRQNPEVLRVWREFMDEWRETAARQFERSL